MASLSQNNTAKERDMKHLKNNSRLKIQLKTKQVNVDVALASLKRIQKILMAKKGK